MAVLGYRSFSLPSVNLVRDRNWSQAQLAQASGLAPSVVSRLNPPSPNSGRHRCR